MGISNENYSTGDINKTNIIQRLIQIPKEKRDGKWEQLFLENIAKASLCCHDTKIITGGDGFPYLQLFLPELNQSFQSYVIENMLDLLIEQGIGIAFNPNTSSMSVDWVFTYGSILNYHLNKVFYSQGEDISSEERELEGEIIMASPSETIFPKEVRALIRNFLKNNGIDEPKMIMATHFKNDKHIREFLFNITPNRFGDEEQFNYVLNGLSWYLPNHYLFSGVDVRDFNAEFVEL